VVPKPPHTTIVITTCDRPDLAARALRSAMAQTEPDVEILVIDDGTREQMTLEATEDRVRVIRTGGRVGVSRARNVGLAEAAGEWITFLDDDDELLPHMVETALGAARDSSLPPPIAVVSGMEEVGPDGVVTLTRRPVSVPRDRHYILEASDVEERRGMAAYNTLLAPVDALRGIGGFDERMPAWMHLDLMLRLNAVCSIEAVPGVAYRMHQHVQPRLSKQHRRRADSMMRTYRKHRGLFRQHPQMLGFYLGRMAAMYLRAGRWLLPVSLTWRSLLAAPRRPRALRQLLLALAGPRVFAWYGRDEDRGSSR
jgi:glycosyltransferase involved in cell wall biosynthesis